MKKSLILLILPFVLSCSQAPDRDTAKKEIFQAEKAFEKMASEKGLAEAFWYFASDSATILRGNDSLITGKSGIRNYYEKRANLNVKLAWTPDFIDVSDCGTLGYTYGKYVYSITDSTGTAREAKGIFHTVWKKENGEWKYVWD